MIASFLARRRQKLNDAKLARVVEETRNSFECEQYRRRRAAALKGTRNAVSQ
jgi:hypothetical protein